MSDDYSRVLNIIGLTLGLIGVLILFRWGMPFRLPGSPLSGNPIPVEEARDHIYSVCGYVGLVFLFLGWAFQILAVLLPPTQLSTS